MSFEQAAVGKTCPKSTALQPPRPGANFDAGKKTGPGSASGAPCLASLRSKRNYAGLKPFSMVALCQQKGGTAVGLTRKGKGTKLMIVADGEGLPIGFLLESVPKSEIQLAGPTLSSVRVTGRRGRPRSRPSRLICDRGYDSRAFRSYLRSRGIKSCIPTGKRPKGWRPRRGRPPKAEKAFNRKRWKVERTFAWLLSNRRIVMRWEHLVSVYRGFVLIGIAMICLNRLLQ